MEVTVMTWNLLSDVFINMENYSNYKENELYFEKRIKPIMNTIKKINPDMESIKAALK